MMTHRARPILAVLLAGLLLATGCLETAPEPPEDPESFSYIYAAEGEHTAPHPAGLDGGYATLQVSGPSLELTPAGEVTVRSSFQAPQAPEGAPGGPGTRGVVIPAMVTLHGVDGRFVAQGGNETALENATVVVLREDPFTLTGVRQVTAAGALFEQGQVHVTGAPILATPEGSQDPRTSRLETGPDGLTAQDVRLGEDPRNLRPEQGPVGTLHVQTGSYAFEAGPLTFAVQGTVQVPQARGTVSIQPGPGALTLRGEVREGDHVRLAPTSVQGTVDPGNDAAQLTFQADQWYQGERPRFEARLTSVLDGHGQQARVTVPAGENATFWVKGTETSRVGTAPNVHPKLDEGGLAASYGRAWYDQPREGFMAAFVNSIAGIFVDPTITEFAPGQTQYIPFIVQVPEDQASGTYTVEGWLNGDNARSDPFQVHVTVP